MSSSGTNLYTATEWHIIREYCEEMRIKIRDSDTFTIDTLSFNFEHVNLMREAVYRMNRERKDGNILYIFRYYPDLVKDVHGSRMAYQFKFVLDKNTYRNYIYYFFKSI